VNFVEPIRDPALVEDIANYFKDKSDRNYIMYLIGIYTGLRISDILRLKISNVKDRKSIAIREKKTGKAKTFEINPILKRELAIYCRGRDMEDYLIKSREKYNQPIGRSMAYKILQDAAKQFRIESMGTHTLRKTFGYHFYKQYKDIATLQKIFNHSHPEITLRYIGIEQEDIDHAFKGFKIY